MSNKKKNLEDAIKEKVYPLLEETIEKHWGITIPKIEEDLTTKLKNPHLNIYVPLNLSFSVAKRYFKTEFLKREIRLNKGNISTLSKSLGIDRRSVHRAIKNLKINVDELRQEASEDNPQEVIVDEAIRSTLEGYKEIIRPQKMKEVYKEVHEISRNIAKILPPQEMGWKEAEREFEKQFLKLALENNENNIKQTAEKLQLRVETLHRKVKKLDLL